MFKLYLDPGHGGSDTGTVGNGLQEKNLTLDIALRIRNLLVNNYPDIKVMMSRTSDVARSLEERTDEANAWGADYYLSIHINGYNGSVNGYEDFIHNSLSNASETAEYRDIIHEEVMKVNNLFDRGRKKANFHVLRETKMPALLTENGFIDNDSDAAKLKDPNWLQKVAQGHVNGLVKVFDLKSNPQQDIHRVIVDGVQVGSYAENQNVLEEVRRHLKTAKTIVVEKV
ncbi:N-acetylmuramoyl-L-alanine amidase family protein [Bacillus taeanensis]|uniref:N-acetylmuramoyl-L-alanine amidase n=1 Tax=Bacillus taeanensis TaxID=273032 RepID=A0A366XYB3_9BACI|nr:N-acetylmuramoyl-L-alanine amidase [Bacillus taeanensis]RBW68911.1 N-acetylmuramoyl-L-alanine amidase [Bacillus taeanensis]